MKNDQKMHHNAIHPSIHPVTILGSVKADDAEITLTLMAQGNGQPKPMELGSFTRVLAAIGGRCCPFLATRMLPWHPMVLG